MSTSLGWKGNRRSGVALAMRHRCVNGLWKGDEHPADAPSGVWHSFCGGGLMKDHKNDDEPSLSADVVCRQLKSDQVLSRDTDSRSRPLCEKASCVTVSVCDISRHWGRQVDVFHNIIAACSGFVACYNGNTRKSIYQSINKSINQPITLCVFSNYTT